MRRNAILVFILIAVIIWGLFRAGDSVRGFANGLLPFSASNVEISQNFAADTIQNVIVEANSSNVKVVRSSTNEVEVRLHGKANAQLSKKIELKSEPKGDTLKLGIEKPERFAFGFGAMNLTLTVALPEKRWNEINVRVGSGNINVEKVEGKSVQARAGSGNVTMTAAKAGTIELKTSSGNVEANEFKAEALSFNVQSGNVTLKNGEAKLKGETRSGNIRISMAELLHDVEVEAGSGNVKVTLDHEPKSLTVDYSGKSGVGKIAWNNFSYNQVDSDRRSIKGTFGSGETKLKVVTGSGNFTLD